MGASSVTTGDMGERSPNKAAGDVVVVVVVVVVGSFIVERAAFSAFIFALAAAFIASNCCAFAAISSKLEDAFSRELASSHNVSSLLLGFQGRRSRGSFVPQRPDTVFSLLFHRSCPLVAPSDDVAVSCRPCPSPDLPLVRLRFQNDSLSSLVNTVKDTGRRQSLVVIPSMKFIPSGIPTSR